MPRPTQFFAFLATAALLVASPSFAQVSDPAVAAREAGADEALVTSACEPADQAADSDDNIVWGTGIVWCGADQASEDDNIVWGTVIANPDESGEAGDANLSLDDNIVWGT